MVWHCVSRSNTFVIRPCTPHRFTWASRHCLLDVSLLNPFPHAQSLMIRFVCTSKVCWRGFSGNSLDPHSSTRPPTDRTSCRTREPHPIQPHSITSTSSCSGGSSRRCLGAYNTVHRETRGPEIGLSFFGRSHRGQGSVSDGIGLGMGYRRADGDGAVCGHDLSAVSNQVYKHS